MNKFLLSSFIALQIGNGVVAQTSNLGEPTIFKNKIAKTTTYFTTPYINNEEEIVSEKARQTASGDKMYRFGKEHSVDLDVFALAESSVLPNGDILYQYGIECKNAVSINLVFDRFELANGVKIYFADPIKKKFDGAYTHLNNNPSKMLGTELIYAEKAIIEIVVPQDKVGQSTLHLGTIIHGYRSLDDMAKALNSSGDLNASSFARSLMVVLPTGKFSLPFLIPIAMRRLVIMPAITRTPAASLKYGVDALCLGS